MKEGRIKSGKNKVGFVNSEITQYKRGGKGYRSVWVRGNDITLIREKRGTVQDGEEILVILVILYRGISHEVGQGPHEL